MSEFDPTLTLLYRFQSSLGLSPQAGLGPVLDFTRNSVATYKDKVSGLLKTAAIDEPRFEAEGLLIEEARTNTLDRSIGMEIGYTGTASGLVELGFPSPDGNVFAGRLYDDGGGGTGTVRMIAGTEIAAGSLVTTYTFFLKADQSDWCRMSVQAIGVRDVFAFFDLKNGVVGASTGIDNISESIERWSNGWWRCSITFTSDAVDSAGNCNLYVALGDNDFQDVPLDGNRSIRFAFPQVELGTFPTSWIPTAAAAETRVVDVCNSLDVSWLNQSSGSVYLRAQILSTSRTEAGRIFYIADTGDSDTMNFLIDTNERIQFNSVNSGDTGGTITGSAIAAKTMTDFAMAYADDDMVVYASGAADGADITAAFPPTDAFTNFAVGCTSSGNAQLNGHIAEIRYYNVRKPNTFLESMSAGETSPLINGLTVPTLEDEILRATGGPTVNDGLMIFYGGVGALEDRERAYLVGTLGATDDGRTNQDMWMEVLPGPGTLNDRQLVFWTGQ